MSTLDEKVKDYVFGRTSVPDGKTMALCQVCGTFEPKKPIVTGKYVGENMLCEHCIEKNKGLAYLVCEKCGKFLGFYKPGIVKLESGVRVQIEPGDTLHTVWCAHCNPDEPSADIAEFRDIMAGALKNAPETDAGLKVEKGSPS